MFCSAFVRIFDEIRAIDEKMKEDGNVGAGWLMVDFPSFSHNSEIRNDKMV